MRNGHIGVGVLSSASYWRHVVQVPIFRIAGPFAYVTYSTVTLPDFQTIDFLDKEILLLCPSIGLV